MNIFTENLEKCACRICFTIENVEDTFQCSYNDEAMVDIVNILLKLPQPASYYLKKLCVNCLKAIINVHLFVRKLTDRTIFWENALSSPRTKFMQTIALPTDSGDSDMLYDQKLLLIDKVSNKIEEHNDCRNADSEHVDYELIIKDESHDIIDADDCDVHHNNDECSNFDDEDNLRLRNLSTTANRVNTYSSVNSVPKYQNDFLIAEGESKPVTERVECNAEKEASTPAQAKKAENSAICKECGKMYSINTIKRHMKLHKNPKAFQCDICDYVGIQIYGHRKRYHDKLAEPLACQECDSVHYSLHDFKEHLKIHDQKYRVQALNISSTNVCHICDKPFFLADALAKHILCHDENSDTWCKLCQKGFSSNTDYKRHMRIHTGEKPFACSYCPKQFSIQGHMKNHVKMHRNKHEFKCEFCLRTFNFKQSLAYHRRLHMGVMQNCQFCNRQFASTTNLYIHISKVHSERVVSQGNFKSDEKAKAVASDEDIADALNAELSSKNAQNIL